METYSPDSATARAYSNNSFSTRVVNQLKSDNKMIWFDSQL
jgi:hypothetical protein